MLQCSRRALATVYASISCLLGCQDPQNNKDAYQGRRASGFLSTEVVAVLDIMVRGRLGFLPPPEAEGEVTAVDGDHGDSGPGDIQGQKGQDTAVGGCSRSRCPRWVAVVRRGEMRRRSVGRPGEGTCSYIFAAHKLGETKPRRDPGLNETRGFAVVGPASWSWVRGSRDRSRTSRYLLLGVWI